MQELSSQRALPRRLADVVRRAALETRIVQWASHRDGRSNGTLADIYLLALDTDPGLIVVKLAGEDARSRDAVEHERATLQLLTGKELPVPALVELPGRLPGELASTFLPGGPLEQLVGTVWDPAVFSTDFAIALARLWESTSNAKPEPHPGAHKRTMLLDVLDAPLAEALESWESGATERWAGAPIGFLHGDLRPANIRVRLEDNTVRFSGFVDFAMAHTGPKEDDAALLFRTLREVHPELPDRLRETLPPMDASRLRDAEIRLVCTMLSDATTARDWEQFRRVSAELDRLLRAERV